MPYLSSDLHKMLLSPPNCYSTCLEHHSVWANAHKFLINNFMDYNGITVKEIGSTDL